MQPADPQMILRTEHLVKKYGKRTVVNDVSIQLRQGEIVGLLGPNGAGKTTTFYMTTGLVTANNGKIFLNDEDIIDISEGYMEGDKIHITAGPLLGQEGFIKKVKPRQGIAILEMNIFNRTTEVYLGMDLITK